MELSWETPRNADEIRRVCSNAILKQWMIPSITFGVGDDYKVSDTESQMIVSGYRTNYKITIEVISAQ